MPLVPPIYIYIVRCTKHRSNFARAVDQGNMSQSKPNSRVRCIHDPCDPRPPAISRGSWSPLGDALWRSLAAQSSDLALDLAPSQAQVAWYHRRPGGFGRLKRSGALFCKICIAPLAVPSQYLEWLRWNWHRTSTH